MGGVIKVSNQRRSVCSWRGYWLALVVAALVLLQGCGPAYVWEATGGNVGALTAAEQRGIAGRMFRLFKGMVAVESPVVMKPVLAGELYFEELARKAGYGVASAGERGVVSLDFYYLPDDVGYVGVMNVDGRRVVRRFVLEGGSFRIVGGSFGRGGVSGSGRLE